MKRILLIGTSRNMVSGVSTHINQLMGSELAAKYGIDNFVVGSDGKGESILHKIQRFILSPFSLGKKILTYKPDLIHLNSAMDFKGFFRDSVYMFVAKSLGKRVIFQLHAGLKPSVFFNKSSWLFWLRKLVLETADAVLLLSELEAGHAAGFCHYKLLKVVPNAIDVAAFGQPVAKPADDSGEVVLVYIGRLVSSKGVKEDIEALAILLKRGCKNIRLRIAGSGPFEQELIKLSQSLKVENFVEFMGPIFGQEKMNFWRDADLLVFPTYFDEGLPYSILEALASGTPVITTRVGGIPETIEGGVQGLFVEPKNAEAVADAIQELISNKSLLKMMSDACIGRANARYSIRRLSNQIDAIYQAVL